MEEDCEKTTEPLEAKFDTQLSCVLLNDEGSKVTTCKKETEFVAVNELTFPIKQEPEYFDELGDKSLKGTIVKEELDIEIPKIDFCESEDIGIESADNEENSAITPDRKQSKELNISFTYHDYWNKKKSYVIAQIRTHTGEKKYYVCPIVEKSKLIQKPLKKKIVEKRYACPHCNYKGRWRANFYTHLKIHTGVKPFVCPHCDYRAIQKVNLVKHLKTHVGKKPLLCPHCNCRYANKWSLANHLRTHSNKPTYSCTDCNYRSTDPSRFEAHQRTHRVENCLICDYCDYRCTMKQMIVSHMKTHLGDKRLICQKCEYKCKTKANLTRHLKIHEKEEKEFVCNYCNYRCTRKGNLTNHLKRHIKTEKNVFTVIKTSRSLSS